MARIVWLLLLLPLLMTLLIGCDDKEGELRKWQQEQVTQVQRHAQQNAETTRALVDAEAETQRQFLRLEQDFQTQRNALEQDRQAVATARERVPLLANALQGISAILLGILALGVCGYLLLGAQRDDGTTELEESLLLELSGESVLFNQLPLSLSGPNTAPAPKAIEGISSTDSSTTIPSGDSLCRTS